LLVPAGDADELTAALARLYSDPALRTRLGKAARQTIETRYSFRERMGKIALLYDRVLNC
jgi:glycosyltransferase involved in cell wall biosynthesis